jgi:carbamoyltransferase
MKTNDLLLTLGHNSSAIMVESHDGGQYKVVCGYEEERFTLKKSDSAFPILAIQRCMRVAGVEEVNRVYVSHWAPDGQLSSMTKKHWSPEYLPRHNDVVSFENQGLTHHDAHAHAATWYANSQPGLKPENTMLFVIDGFGNFGEHISIYQMDKFGPKLVRRFFGYEFSLGLMYQYMTGFMGMKQHEDEYKILGYEVLIDSIDVDRHLLVKKINSEVTRYLDSYFDNKKMVGEFDPLLRIDALPAMQKACIDKWTKLCKELGVEDPTSHTGRVILGYFVQSVLEGVVLTLIKVYRPTNIIGSGGVFYNVKLNRRILDVIPGKLCVFPLAGDQGNALGLFYHDNGLEWPGHLNWGVRPKANYTISGLHKGLEVALDWQTAAHLCLEHIDAKGMVNLVRGAMEFGPRAMCNTSTLAAPIPAVVNRINRMNGRNTVMPMAPVMNRSEFQARMQMTGRIHLSEQHMIIALPYKKGAADEILGAAHPYPNEYTGRPQVMDGDPLMDSLFSYRPVLINTSFNVHGRPIAYSYDDVIANHVHERKVEPITTVYLETSNETSG